MSDPVSEGRQDTSAVDSAKSEVGGVSVAPALSSEIQILRDAGDITSSVAFVGEIPETDLGTAARDDQSALGITDTRSNRARRWTRLDSITVRNFKATQDVTIPLGNVTILVGPNGSGKSSVLQAVHWAARAASYVAPKNTKEMISFERLDYVPSSEPLRTAHKSELKTDSTSTPVEVVFSHIPFGEERTAATVKIRAARNRGGITAYMEGGSAVTPYKQRFQFITTYIPGLAGLSERESILAQPSLRRQAASGDAGGVMRNILLNLRSRRLNEVDDSGGTARLKRLNEYIDTVHPGSSVDVSFDEREDYHITATYSSPGLDNQDRPLETAATGLLQVVQIFSYLILFEPKIMLIDEPDAHLHPDKQERLIETLERAATESETQIILTTHSPHIARGASPSAKLVWMNQGRVETDDGEAIRRLLGWGGLDKAALFFVEDEDDTALRAILRQWPELSRQVAICRCFGIENLPKDTLLRGLPVDGQIKTKAIIHRDGDFMNTVEAKMWSDRFKTEGTFPWVTSGCDVEAYFCTTPYLSNLYDVATDVAEGWRSEAAAKIKKAKETFFEKRKLINRELYPDGGSPNSEHLWLQAGGSTAYTVVGKKLLSALKEVIKSKGYDDKRLNTYRTTNSYEVASDLRALLESCLLPHMAVTGGA
ncbi:ABC-type cobalamin/Fe3+-siderophores transport system ATPase subunit [Kaistia hirudinis]|uniref:ABC-type cobalamin/Fe3+-siderophores transport system ATPase subunit n=1 Tax=Kaistia hirudinis TaxID=1293440 RepID=A0A840AQR7_9HYPH|nr:ABC-type cobalamin/Fe3+-siderophores transport system ATPase subunit [Kaistia hirudinis]